MRHAILVFFLTALAATNSGCLTFMNLMSTPHDCSFEPREVRVADVVACDIGPGWRPEHRLVHVRTRLEGGEERDFAAEVSLATPPSGPVDVEADVAGFALSAGPRDYRDPQVPLALRDRADPTVVRRFAPNGVVEPRAMTLTAEEAARTMVLVLDRPDHLTFLRPGGVDVVRDRAFGLHLREFTVHGPPESGRIVHGLMLLVTVPLDLALWPLEIPAYFLFFR